MAYIATVDQAGEHNALSRLNYDVVEVFKLEAWSNPIDGRRFQGHKEATDHHSPDATSTSHA